MSGIRAVLFESSELRPAYSTAVFTSTRYSHTHKYDSLHHSSGRDFDPFEYATEETVILSPIPCWEHLSTEEYRDRVHGLVEEAEEEASEDR